MTEKKQISLEDAEWLDGAANPTDETLFLEKLSEASDDHEKTFEDLSLPEKTVAEWLWQFKQAAIKVVVVTRAKQKVCHIATLSGERH